MLGGSAAAPLTLKTEERVCALFFFFEFGNIYPETKKQRKLFDHSLFIRILNRQVQILTIKNTSRDRYLILVN